MKPYLLTFTLIGGVSMGMSKKRHGILQIVIILTTLLIFVGCTKQNAEPTEPLSRTEVWLDTPCKVTIYDNATEENLDKAFAALKSVHDKMNVNSEDSEVSKINKNAGIDYVKVSDETFYVISEAKKYSGITKGKFDISVGPLVKLWGINTDHERVPSEKEVKQNLALVNYNDILLNEKDKSVMLKNKGMSIDLGGIAKGYAADAIAKELKKNGVDHALINLGGNILTLGGKPDGTDWRVGVQNPFSPRGDYLGIVAVTDKAIVTSGIYERFFEQDNKIYHHIFDTSTGYPVDNTLSSVTIITDDSINGDALAKAFTMGLEEGLKFVEGYEGIEGIFITKNQEVYVTSGLKDNFTITDSTFTLKN
jgi:FAD:protein FMN transferase